MNARRIGTLLVPFALVACGTGSGSSGSRLAVEVSILDFGDVLIGSSRTRNVTIKNNQQGFREITGFSLSENTSGNFAITSRYETIDLAPGASVTCQVTYSPGGSGVDLGTLYIEEPGKSSTVSLVGSGVPTPAPQVEVSPESLDFGGVLVGSSITLEVTIQNVGSAPLDVTTSFDRVTSGDFDAPDFPRGDLAPGASMTFGVTYTPDSSRPDTGGIIVSSDDANEPEIAVALTGSGIMAPAPEISVSPLALDFGEVLVSGSATREFVIRNQGTADLEVSDILLGSGVSEEFLLIAPAGRMDLAPGSELVVEVVYAPDDGPADSGTLRVVSDDADEPITVVSLAGIAAQTAVPEIEVTPAALDFGDVVVGNTSSLDVTVRNTGSAVLSVGSVSLAAGSSSRFTFSPAGAFDLDPDTSRVFTISYTADDAVADSGVLRVASNDADEGLVSVSLSGNGASVSTPDISVDRSTVAFGSVQVGDTASQRLWITNTGDAPLTVHSVRLGAGTSPSYSLAAAPNDGTVLGAGQSRSVDVTFSPQTAGAGTGTLRIASDDGDEPLIVVALSGTGEIAQQPEIDVTPSTLVFGNVLIGSSRGLSVLVSNTGTAPLTIFSVRSGSGTAFSITSGPPDGTVIQAGQSRTINLSYAPLTDGLDTDALRIASDDADEPQITVSLSGNGVSVPEPEIDVTPTTLAFGNVRVGDSSALFLSVSNLGTAPLTISSVRLGSNTAFSITSGPADGTIIPAGQSRAIDLSYAPVAEGPDTETLDITSDDAHEPVITVALSGSGVSLSEPEIDVNPTALAFGSVLTGDSRALSLSIANTGSSPLTIASVRLGSGTSSSYSITARPADGTAIPAGQSSAVEVTYSPGSEGADAGTLRIVSDDADEPLVTVPLSGSATSAPEPEISLTRTSLAFGTVEVGEFRELRLWISNTGDAPLTIHSVSLGSGTSSTYTILSKPADGSTVAVGRSSPVDVLYAPGTAGAHSGTLRIASDDADESLLIVPLSGAGTIDTTVTLAWDAPTTDKDGAPLASLTGYKLYVGQSPGFYTQVITLGAITTYTLDSLAPGRYYMAVTAYNGHGESVHSEEIIVDLP